MNEANNPDGVTEGIEDQEIVPEAPEPSEGMYNGAEEWGSADDKINRGNKGMLIAFVLLLVVGGVVGVLWYMDKVDYEKWDKELKSAMRLPDGEFESALRSLLEKSDRKDILAQVAYELGEAGDKQAAPLLAKAVSKGGTVGLESAKALAKIGGKESKVGAEPIFAQMNKTEEMSKAIYAWALCTLGDSRGFGPLLEAIGKRIITTSSLPEFDADLIVRIGTTDKLVEMAGSSDPLLRMYASMELGFRTDMDVVPALLKLVKDDNLDVAEQAAISLGRTTDKRAGPALLETMQTKKALRDSILSAITQSVGSPGLEAIYQNVKNDAPFKYKIIGKLKKLRDPRSKDLLMSILDEKFPGSDKDSVRQADEIRNQALWTLEELGDPRIMEMMYQKTQWERMTEEQIPDPSVRYRQDDMARKIANGVVGWFGKVRPKGAEVYLKKIYEANKPYSNTPECAQRVQVDIGPLMDAMGRTGDKSFCPNIEPFLDQDEGFYFQAASHALARLNCKGTLKSFIKRMVMTKEERKEEKFSSLLESRDWQMEDRLQERRNSIMALKFMECGEAGETLMEIVLDPEDDQELRREAASSLAYCSDDAVMDKILETIKDQEIDIVVRAALIQGLYLTPNDKATAAMLEILEGTGNFELVKPAAIVIGEAGNPANDARLNKLLDHEDEHRQRAALFAILLGGNDKELDKLIELLKGQETRLVLRQWYESHPIFLTKKMFDSNRVFRRLILAKAISKATENTGDEILWPWKHLMQRLKTGWEDGPGGLTSFDIRTLMADTVRNVEEYRELAAKILSGLSERGYLLTLQAEKGPQGTVARDMLRHMNVKSQ
ncbi:MAG: HEAT repeat domain-containing protein [Deltaproteobacteria bacterium]|nr:HEAT repeat domain-containing protein [Deltaproteobacteria bacterium]